MKATTYTVDDLAVLVCSANVGNAEPTQESFNNWIPDDGAITTGDVGVEELDADSSARNINKIKEQYDFIIIGMQEAAFTEGKKKKEELDESVHSADEAISTRSSGSNNIKSSGKGSFALKIDKVALALRGLAHTQTTRA
jgi:hypothetical protein